MKSWAILIVLVVAFLLVICLPKYLEAKPGCAINNSGKLTVKVPNLPYVNMPLNGVELQFGIKNIILVGYILLMTSWRILLLKKVWRWDNL